MNGLFHPQVDIQKRIDEVTSKFTTKTIGVHIRRTDHAKAIAQSPLSKFFDLLDKYAKKYGRNQALQYMLTDNNRHLIEVYGSDNTKTGFFSKYIQAFREMKSMRIREEISKYCEINWI